MEKKKKRGKKIIAVGKKDTLTSAALEMKENNIGCLIVNDSEGRLIGIISERDLALRAAAESLDFNTTTVGEIMTEEVLTVPRKTHHRKARELMMARNIRHLPIVKDGAVCGMFSVKDVMKQQMIEDKNAAQEVIMLSTCLKSIDLEEAINNVTIEIPKMFGARGSLLYMEAGSGLNNGRPIIGCHNFIYKKDRLNKLLKQLNKSHVSKDLTGAIKNACDKSVKNCKRVIIGLSISGAKDRKQQVNKSLSGFLYICSVDKEIYENKDLLKYKVELVKELLEAHLSNAWRLNDVRTASMTDTLTQVGSREFMEEKMITESERSLRYGRPMSVAILDVDWFKNINDSLGHFAGDDALRKLADCMKRQMRNVDILARYGGDEFVIIMPETTAENALHLLERLREDVHNIHVADDIKMSISCGVAECLPIDGDDSGRQILQRADLALYEAKCGGRDCVKIYKQKEAELV